MKRWVDAPVNVVLISTYELGRQPFGLASPAAWLRQRGAAVACMDLSREAFREEPIRAADLVAFFIPMHTATRLAVELVEPVRRLNPRAHLCFYGLYAPVNESYLRGLGVDTILGGEFEAGLAHLVERLASTREPAGSSSKSRFSDLRPRQVGAIGVPASDLVRPGGLGMTNSAGAGPSARPAGAHGGSPLQSESLSAQAEPVISLERQQFIVPDRAGLVPLEQYAHLILPGGAHRTVGYTEASRGCKHLCRHCPIVPVYNGVFRVVQREVVLEDIRRQVAAGAQHITFGDPDFFNGIGHALAIVEALRGEHPQLTYDATIKIEHLLKHAQHILTLRETGCLFVTSAVESVDDAVLARLDKGHTRADFLAVVELFRDAGLALQPTFVPFTPWTTLEGYCDLLEVLRGNGLVENVAPVQLAIRLLIPAGSRLLELAEMRALVEPFDQAALVYPWKHADPRVDALCAEVQELVRIGEKLNRSRTQTFRRIWQAAAVAAEAAGFTQAALRPEPALLARAAIPYLNEPWYC